MKHWLILTAVFSFAQLASAKVLLTCSDGEQTQVKITQSTRGLIADVTVESTGGSYPTFHYPVERNGKVYRGKNFRLSVRGDRGTLTASKLGIDRALLDCSSDE